jgi:hypothetical protein
MSKELDRRVKTALNETRLLILGVQVLLGFEFQSFFQDGFDALPALSRLLLTAGLLLGIAATAVLVIPSMQHRLLEAGQSSVRLVRAASFFTGLALAPLAASLGLSAYVVAARHFGVAGGAAVGVGLAGLASFAWFGLEVLIGIRTGVRSMPETETPLATKIEQLLTEARVIIPGAQALFGFQFIAMLTTGFDRLPQTSKLIHVAALCLIVLNAVLLMTPAALHRLSFGGNDSPAFLRIGSGIVIAAPIFLAAGIAGDVYVVMQKAFANEAAAMSGSAAVLLVLALLWYGFPLALRWRGNNETPTRSRAAG